MVAESKDIRLLNAYVRGLPQHGSAFAIDPLVLAVPKGNPAGIRRLEDVGELPPEAVCTPPYMLEARADELDDVVVPVNEDSSPDCGTPTVDAVAAGDLAAAAVPGSAVNFVRLLEVEPRPPVAERRPVRRLRDGARERRQRSRDRLPELRRVEGRPGHHRRPGVRPVTGGTARGPDQLVCITGMHRSGTSLLARVVNLLGVDLGAPGALMGPGPDNPAGYWENRAIKELDDEVLAHLGGAWDQPPLLEAGWELDAGLDPFRDRAREILGRDFAGPAAGPVGCKEPRLCLLHPFWRTVVPISHTVVVVRHPTEVVASLVRRNGMDPGQGAVLWLRYLLAVGAPADGSVLVVRLDDLTDRPDATAARLATHLGLPAARARPPRRGEGVARSGAPAPRDCGRRGRPRHHGVAEPRPRAHRLERRRGRPRRAADGGAHRGRRGLARTPGQPRRARRRPGRGGRAAGEAPQVAPTAKGAGGGRPGGAPPSAAALRGRRRGRGPVSPTDHLTGVVTVAPGWTLMPAARDRMLQRLARAGDDVVAIAAVAGPLPAGQSARNHAERLAVQTADAPASTSDGRDVPALVHRAEVAVSVGAGGVALPEGRVVVDPGAHAHRADAVAELADAVDHARPVFPWRPVVLLVATEPDPAGWEGAVALVDALQEIDVDARLALPAGAPVPSSRWVQPALASEATLRRTRPDAVLAWDAGAVEAAETWATGLRSLVIVERTGDGASVATVPWRIDVARGRVRGSFGRAAEPTALATLVRRLAAGPQPEAPDPTVVIGRRPQVWDKVDASIGVHRRPTERSCVFVVGPVAPAARRAAEALAAHMSRAAVHVELVAPDAVPSTAPSADLVLLQGAGPAVARELVARRADRPTVLHLDATDLDPDGGLRAGSADVLARCGLAVAATTAGVEVLRAAPVETRLRTMVLPALMPGGRYADLRRAKVPRHRGPLRVIGWAPGDDGDEGTGRAVEWALRVLLEGRPGVRVDLVRGGARLDDLAGVRRLQNEVQPHSAARWSVLLLTCTSRSPLHDEPVLLAEAGVLGVPTLLADGTWATRPGRLAVADPDDRDEWLAAVTAILDDRPGEEGLRFETAAAADALERPAVADAVVHRFLGWVTGGRR